MTVSQILVAADASDTIVFRLEDKKGAQKFIRDARSEKIQLHFDTGFKTCPVLWQKKHRRK
jgi:hypothetical protein